MSNNPEHDLDCEMSGIDESDVDSEYDRSVSAREPDFAFVLGQTPPRAQTLPWFHSRNRLRASPRSMSRLLKISSPLRT
jgi:hypothetical protein